MHSTNQILRAGDVDVRGGKTGFIAKAAKGVTVKKVDVVSSSGDFTTKVDPGATAGEFKIEIQPKETTKPLNATLTIKPDVTPAKVYYASARVLPPGTAKP